MGTENNGGKQTDWRAMILAMMLGALTGGAVPILAPPVVRPDPFRGQEAKDLERRMSERQDEALSRLRLEMRVMLPPHATRRRILALEEQLRITAPNFRPPTALWHEE